ncbi:unnamed protein product [Meloidogyne enterolobii]|uniref:Uncharacterized protein n=1 Tax=Meloidogyne enterolobii TaxID=390850 RepID=A0ACB0XUR0_MELEN
MVIQKWQNGKIMGGRDKGRSKKVERRWSCTCKKVEEIKKNKNKKIRGHFGRKLVCMYVCASVDVYGQKLIFKFLKKF